MAPSSSPLADLPSYKTAESFAGESGWEEGPPNRNVDTDRQTNKQKGGEILVLFDL